MNIIPIILWTVLVFVLIADLILTIIFIKNTREIVMEQEKMIREKISNQVWKETNKVVRNVFFIAKTNNNSIIYGVSGNNNKLFCNAEMFADGSIKLVY